MFQDSVPAGSYNDPFLSSVIPMVAPTWCHRASWGNLRCGVNVDSFELWIDTFELVIRISKVQQLAIQFCTFLEKSCCSGCPLWNLEELSSVTGQLYGTFQNLLFRSNLCSVIATCHDICTRQAHDLQVWSPFFWWLSGEVIHFVHLIRWNL